MSILLLLSVSEEASDFTSQPFENGTFIFTQDIGNSKPVEVIKVHFKNAFRGADQDLATVDRIWQISGTNLSQVIGNNSSEVLITTGTPLILHEGYELAIKSIDIDGNKAYLELSKNGEVVAYNIIIPPQEGDDTYTYAKDIGQAKDVEIIKIHFKNAFRGADQDLAIIDRIWQTSDTNPSHVIDNSSKEIILTTSKPLELKEDYELTIKSIDIDGNKVYLELSKSGKVVASKIVIPLQTAGDTYTYNKDIGELKDIEIIKIHFNSAFRGPDQDFALVDRIWQKSDTNPAKIIDNTSRKIIMTSNSPLKLQGSYELAIKSIDITGNKLYLKLSSNGTIVDEAILNVNPKNSRILYALLLLFGAGKYDEAIQIFDKVIEQDPQNAFAWFFKGLALVFQGELNEALKAFDNGIKLDPLDPDIWYLEGAVLSSQGKFDEAIIAYDEALELNPQYETAWIEKGNALGNLSKNAEAIQAYDKAIEINPNSANAWNDKGFALHQLKKFNEAIKAYDKALQIDRNFVAATLNRAAALKALGREKEAEAVLSKYFDQPEWMELTTYEAGDGFIAYMILHNKNGVMTMADGTLKLEIYEKEYFPSTSLNLLWSKSYAVKKDQFIDTRVGMGAFEHPAKIWMVGRIPYDSIHSGLGGQTLEVQAYFKTEDGRTLKDKASFYVS